MLGLSLDPVAVTALLPSLSRRWWTEGALFDADFVNGRFYRAGAEAADEASWLASLGGSRSGGTLTFGPSVKPDSAELVTNGDFSLGTSGWSGQTGGTIVAGTAECVLSGNGGNSPAVAQSLAVQIGRAYRLRGKARRISLNATLAVSTNANVNGAQNFASQTVTTTAGETLDLPFSAFATPVSAGLRLIANPANGDGGLDDVSVRELMPYHGYLPGGVSAAIEAVTPPATGSDKVLWQADDGAVAYGVALERNLLRLVWNADGHLRFVALYQTAIGTVAEQANLDLGTIAPSTPFRVVFSAAPNAFRAALAGGPEKTASSGLFPGLAAMRLGRSHAGQAWDGGIRRLTLFPAAQSTVGFQRLAADSGSIVAWGDSLTAGSGASGEASRYPSAAQTLFSPPRGIVNQGVGGQTSTEIAARMGAVPISLTLTGNEIPASGIVSIITRSASPITAQGPQTLSGTLAGVPGQLQRAGDGSYSFLRSAVGSIVPCPAGTRFVPDMGAALNGRICWLWPGRNNFADPSAVKADIAAMVASLAHDRYLVGSVLNGNYASEYRDQPAYNVIKALNADLAALYGSRFVDLRSALIAAADPVADADDITRDIVPTSLRSDNIHLNDAGYAIVAAAWKAATLARGW